MSVPQNARQSNATEKTPATPIPIWHGWPKDRIGRTAKELCPQIKGAGIAIFDYLFGRRRNGTHIWADSQVALGAVGAGNCSRSTVMRWTGKLVTSGLLEVVEQGGSRYAGSAPGRTQSRQRISTVYRVTPEKVIARHFEALLALAGGSPECVKMTHSGADLNASKNPPECVNLTPLPYPSPVPALRVRVRERSRNRPGRRWRFVGRAPAMVPLFGSFRVDPPVVLWEEQAK